eukprot:gene31370-40756_t
MNDIFRFGSGRNDRFLSIFERVDNTLSQSFVHFVGFEASLYKIGNYTSVFYCTFFHNSHLHTLPVPSSHESTLTVVHERMLHGYDNEITCKIPKLDCCHGEPLSLSLGMVQKHSLLNISSFPEESGPKYSSVVYPTLSQSLTLLLPLVRLPRAEVSRILRFNVSMSTMVSSLRDPLVVEWLLYHLLLGVEHFYLFDNSKGPCCWHPNTTTSTLRSNCTCAQFHNHSDSHHLPLPPRLAALVEAGLVTIIPYPFSPSKGLHWNSVQRFGHVTRWVGFNDIDEFFLPAQHHRRELVRRLRKIFQPTIDSSIVEQTMPPAGVMTDILDAVLDSHATRNQSASGIVFSVQEMGCEDGRNYYLSPHPASSRVAVTLTCLLQGSLFREKHTKIFLRPQFCPYLRSPHTEQRAIKGHFSKEKGIPTFSTEVQGGLFLHYNRMKYSRDLKRRRKKKNKRSNTATTTATTRFLEMKRFVSEMLDAIGPDNNG